MFDVHGRALPVDAKFSRRDVDRKKRSQQGDQIKPDVASGFDFAAISARDNISDDDNNISDTEMNHSGAI